MQSRIGALDLRMTFILRQTFTNLDHKNPIILRVTYRGEKRDTYTGFYIVPGYWIPKVGRVNAASHEAAAINNRLDGILHEVRGHFDELKYSRMEFSIDDLADKIRGKNPPPETLMEYVEEEIKDYAKRVDVDLKTPTFYKYQRVKNYLVEFLQTTRKMKNIPVSRVDSELLKQFYYFLRKEKGNCNNSAVTLMNFLKTVLKKPVKRGQIKEDPFMDMKLRFEAVDRGFLTKDDLGKLEQWIAPTESLERNRDIFLLCCYTGLAYSDVRDFSGSHIIKDPDETFYIKKPRAKTGIVSIIPLLPAAERILKKFCSSDDVREFKLFVPCNQKLNESLKVIGERSGIERVLHMHLARHTFATTVTLANRVPIESVSKMLGHSSVKHTQRYARVVGEKLKSDMAFVKGIFL
ncbi:MAG: site-specific integrase [Ferruginibacter sp.]